MAAARKKGVRVKTEGPLRVPRPLEIWLTSIMEEKNWRNFREKTPWFETISRIAGSHGCQIVFDKRRHWKESVYRRDFQGRGPVILAGGAGRPSYVCTALLHELGHHLSHSPEDSSISLLDLERQAWDIAVSLAGIHALPFSPDIRRQGMYSYRWAFLQQRTSGSKSKRKNRPLPKSFQLATSQRSSKVSIPQFYDAVGKKGKRGVKREIKRATSKAERRKRNFRE